MSVWGGTNFVSEVPVLVVEVAPGVGRIVCLECGGDQERYRALFPPEIGVTHCIDCKGTGRVLINI